MAKQFYLIVDTETANTLECPLVYDIGWVVCDSKGKIYKQQNFLISDVFNHEFTLMNTSYYHTKIPMYWKMLWDQKVYTRTIYEAMREIRSDIKKYHIRKVGAYNAHFDKHALNTTLRYYTHSKHRWFFPYGVEWYDIWNMAVETFMISTDYVKTCLEKGWISEKGNILTNAEIAYRYIFKQDNFLESHTALDDAIIESKIFAQCHKQARFSISKAINRLCWQKPQRIRKKLEKSLDNELKICYNKSTVEDTETQLQMETLKGVISMLKLNVEGKITEKMVMMAILEMLDTADATDEQKEALKTYAEHRLEKLEERNTKAKEKRASNESPNKQFYIYVEEALQGSQNPLQIKEILNVQTFPEYKEGTKVKTMTAQKLARVLREMVDTGMIIRIEDGKKLYFKMA